MSYNEKYYHARGNEMGRKSIKENKTRFQLSRENAGFTREGAAATLEFISADRIEKIENEKTFPRPEEVIAMSESYNDITLCNYYCTHCCDIGQKYMPEIKTKELSQITLEMLATLNILTKQKDRLIEITVDGQISDDEKTDFLNIRNNLDDMSLAIESLKLWIRNTID